MNKDRKIWLCEQNAQKAWTLSLNLAQEAARAGVHGQGYAVIANESRKLANKLFDYAANLRFDSDDEKAFNGIVEFALQMSLLGVNAFLEILRVNVENDRINNKSMAVCAEEIRLMALSLIEISDVKAWQKPFVIPEITSPLKSTLKYDFFFQYSIGNIPLVENTVYIREICSIPKSAITDGSISLRGTKIPTLDCYSRFNLDYSSFDSSRQTVMIIWTKPNKSESAYAVLIDDLDVNAIFHSRIGYAVPPKTSHTFAEYARECWDAIGYEQLLFIDWDKLKKSIAEQVDCI